MTTEKKASSRRYVRKQPDTNKSPEEAPIEDSQSTATAPSDGITLEEVLSSGRFFSELHFEGFFKGPDVGRSPSGRMINSLSDSEIPGFTSRRTPSGWVISWPVDESGGYTPNTNDQVATKWILTELRMHTAIPRREYEGLLQDAS